jgi:hypothetical protein
MAIDTAGSLTYYLSLAVEHKDYLGAIRHWENLKLAFGDDLVWVKDLTSVQADSTEVKSIPFKELYYASGPKLFRKGSLLPERNLPSLLWTPITRALPVTLPALNHNYFGVDGKVPVRLVRSEKETESFALKVGLETLAAYVHTAPAIRLGGLQWTIIGETEALITGTPLLPLQGSAFWRRESFLLPAGFDLELPLLYKELNHLLNPHNDSFVLWNEEGQYSILNGGSFTPLSVSSFRITMERRAG